MTAISLMVVTAIAATASKTMARIRFLVSQSFAAIAAARIHQARIEAELYRNRYRLRARTTTTCRSFVDASNPHTEGEAP
jgi:hypothetical protein